MNFQITETFWIVDDSINTFFPRVPRVEKGEFIGLFQGCFKDLVKPFLLRCDTSVIPKSD